MTEGQADELIAVLRFICVGIGLIAVAILAGAIFK